MSGRKDGTAMDVLSVGLMVCDIIAKPVGRDVFDVDSSRIDALKIASGGDALNAAVNMAKLGLRVGLAGRVGCDMMGDFLLREAARHGVNTDLVVKAKNVSTSTSIVLVEECGERHFAYYGRANDSLAPGDIDEKALREARIVHVGSAMALAGLDGPGLAELFRKAKAAGALTSMDVTWDSSGRWLAKIDEALHFTDIFMPSLAEARLIAGKDSPEEMERFFRGYGLRALAVKLGSEGCFVTDFRDRHAIPAFRVPGVLDTTGAGDAFAAGFLAGTVRGMGLRDRGVLGSAVAAQCVTQVGATAGTKNWEETMEFIRNNTN
jgi:sugar/nucleoside kinase (ribokinase family)